MKKLFLALLIIAFSAAISHADEWAKAYGGSDEDWTFSIQETTTGEYITAGYTYSFGAGDSDAWVVKLNSDGTFSWQNSYGGSDYDWAYAINETSDPGYVVAGYTESFGAGGADAEMLADVVRGLRVRFGAPALNNGAGRALQDIRFEFGGGRPG